MKIELVAINAKYVHVNLAVHMLHAYAGQHGVHTEVKEYTINHNADHILEDLYMSHPDVVAFSCYLWNIHYVKEVALELKRLLPELEIWMGGPEVSYDGPKILAEHPEIRGIILGEGEASFLEVCRHYREGISLEDVAGIVYRDRTEDIRNNGRRACLSMDELPFPYEDLSKMENRILYYESSRGCPFSCSYCLSSVDRDVRFKSLPKVYEELQRFLDAKVAQVKFVDRTYNVRVEHALGIWNYIRQHDNGVTNFHFEIAADILTPEEVECLSQLRPGLVQLEIGVQSTNRKTIEEIHRVMKVSKVAAVTEQLKQRGNINLHLDLIAGLPFEDYRTFQRSFDEIFSMRPHQLQLGFLKVLKGSYMYEHAAEYDLLYHTRPPYEVLRTKWLSFREVIALKAVEDMVEVYYNSGQYSTVLGLCFYLRKQYLGGEKAYGFFDGLAGYYREKGLSGIQHSRSRRYEILLGYLTEQEEALGQKPDGEQQKMLREAVLYDLYLRENIKSRPSWAGKVSEEERKNRKEYGSRRHVERFSYDFTENDFYRCRRLPAMKESLVLFDYERRDPVTGNVSAERIEYDEKRTNDRNTSSHG
ncbi:MAG: B12-binding domain-containing radical SAM protein [Lachnospiraceae bacterium]